MSVTQKIESREAQPFLPDDAELQAIRERHDKVELYRAKGSGLSTDENRFLREDRARLIEMLDEALQGIAALSIEIKERDECAADIAQKYADYLTDWPCRDKTKVCHSDGECGRCGAASGQKCLEAARTGEAA